MENKFFVNKLREVKLPTRANSTDAGCDCYVPSVDANFLEDLYSLNYKNKTSYTVNLECTVNNKTYRTTLDDIAMIYLKDEYEDTILFDVMMQDIISILLENGYLIEEKKLTFNWSFTLPAHSRILIPGGIRTTLYPKDSCLLACNKSGVATSKGLIYTCHVIDSFYTGEVCYGVVNTSNIDVEILPENKLLQVLHIPIYLSEPVEVNDDKYDELTCNSDRGTGGFGSSGLK